MAIHGRALHLRHLGDQDDRGNLWHYGIDVGREWNGLFAAEHRVLGVEWVVLIFIRQFRVLSPPFADLGSNLGNLCFAVLCVREKGEMAHIEVRTIRINHHARAVNSLGATDGQQKHAYWN